MVNFALHTRTGFKVICFSEVCLFLCCSKITAENGCWTVDEPFRESQPCPCHPSICDCCSSLGLIKWLILWWVHALSAVMGLGWFPFSFPGTGTKYWLSTSHSAQKLPEESSWSFTKCWFPLGVFAGGWFWIDFDPFGAQLIACIPADIFKTPCVHWSDHWQMLGFGLFSFVFFYFVFFCF